MSSRVPGRAWPRLLTTAAALAALPLPAGAHPHVWMTAMVAPNFDGSGRLVSIREKWAFDYDYSSVVRPQIDQDGDGQVDAGVLGPGGALSWIIDKDYLTHLTVAGREVAHGTPENFSIGIVAAKLMVEFTLPLPEPLVITLGAGVDVYDPENYYDVAFDYPDVQSPTAPASCTVARREKDNLDPVAVMIIRRLGLTADPKVLSDPATGFAVRVAIDCK